MMFEAPGDLPAIDDMPSETPDSSPSPADSSPIPDNPQPVSDPPAIDGGDSFDGGSYDNQQQFDDGYSDQQTEQDDEPTLDEKGEIFAKVKILKEYRALYSKTEDTLDMIDKIDLVQIGNNIRSKDITDIKDGLSQLMTDIYTTIVYEFQLQYKNLKVKMVEYSSRYVILVKSLVSIIKNDQK